MSKQTNSSNLWSFYQKFLVFEEPALKWIHLSKADNCHYFDIRLTKSASYPATNLLNVLLAYEESSYFQSVILEKLATANISKYLASDRVKYWQSFAQTNEFTAQWLTFAECYYPNWQQIAQVLPIADTRIAFISDCQKRLNACELNWHKLYAVFKDCLGEHRHKLPTNFLPTAIILVEGMTEHILLPCFARTYGFDLLSKGAMIIPAGGANKIARKYLYLKDTVKLPIFCLFDRDAQMLAQRIQSILRETDNVYVLADGEIEDLISLDFLVNRVNHYLSVEPLCDISKPVLQTDFSHAEKRTFVLERIWRQRELGKFEKVKFAQFIACEPYLKNLRQDCISADGVQMLKTLAKSIGSLPAQ